RGQSSTTRWLSLCRCKAPTAGLGGGDQGRHPGAAAGGMSGLVTSQTAASVGVAVFDVDGPPRASPGAHQLSAVRAPPGQPRGAAAPAGPPPPPLGGVGPKPRPPKRSPAARAVGQSPPV